MKKLISILIFSAILTSLTGLIGCRQNEIKIGLGIYTSSNIYDADGEVPGQASLTYTFAALLIDKDGKVLDCEMDASTDGDAEITSLGKASVKKVIASKNELGNSYGMSAAGKKEWDEQADAFEKTVIGKTLDEIKTLVTSEGKGTEEVIKAGCTIYVSEFVFAIEKAFVNTKPAMSKDSDIELGVTLSSSTTDSDGATNGSADFTAVATVAIKKDEKITVCLTDEATFGFDITSGGKVKEKFSNYNTKREDGDSYGMSAAGFTEWYLQVDAFDKMCEGKTAEEIAALVTPSGYPGEDIQTAGCTIYAGNFVKSVIKAAD